MVPGLVECVLPEIGFVVLYFFVNGFVKFWKDWVVWVCFSCDVSVLNALPDMVWK